jgi:O-antigen/teichoic acid export membrane protein
MSSLFDNIYQIIFAKYFSFSQTGLYYQAKKIQEIPFGVINNLTQSVLFSGYSKIQGDEKNFFEGYNKLFRFFTIALSFISIILFFFSKEIIILILGFKWIGSIFFLKSLSIVGFFYVQEMLIRMLFKIFNNTVYILKLELIKKIIQIVSIFFGLFYGSIYILIYGLIISNIISFLIYYYIANKKYPFLKLNKNKYLLKGCFVMIITFVFTHFSISMFFIDSFLIKLLLVVFLFFITTLILGLIDLKNDFTFLKKIYG